MAKSHLISMCCSWPVDDVILSRLTSVGVGVRVSVGDNSLTLLFDVSKTFSVTFFGTFWLRKPTGNNENGNDVIWNVGMTSRVFVDESIDASCDVIGCSDDVDWSGDVIVGNDTNGNDARCDKAGDVVDMTAFDVSLIASRLNFRWVSIQGSNTEGDGQDGISEMNKTGIERNLR